jgi:tRNA modification GTPase
VSTLRQADILRQVQAHLQAVLETVDAGMSADFIVIDLRSAWEKLGEITGETVGEDIIDQIFSQFCIGK